MAKRKQGCTIAFVVAVLCLVGAALLGFNWLANNAVTFDDQLSTIRARGEPLTLEELNEYYGGLDPSNAALEYLEAFQMLEDYSSDDLDQVGVEDALSPPYQRNAETHEAIRNFFNSQSETRRILIEAPSLGEARYPIDFVRAQQTGFPHLSPARAACRYLILDATFRAHDGDTNAAVESFLAAAGVLNSLQTDPALTAHLVRAAMVSMLTGGFARLVSFAQFDEAQLDRMEAAIRDAYSSESLRLAMIGERAFVLSAFKNANPITVLDRADLMQLIDELIAITELPAREVPARIAELESIYPQGRPAFLFAFTHITAPSYISGVASHPRAAAEQDLTSLAAAIEKHRLVTGALPDSLAEVESDPFTDPYANAPYRYRKTDNGYVVYSTGPDGKDDGGIPRTRSQPGASPVGDIVLEITR